MNQQVVKVQVKNLTTNHELQLEDGTWQRIHHIDRGWMTTPSKMLHFANGDWSCIENSAIVQAIYHEPEPETQIH